MSVAQLDVWSLDYDGCLSHLKFMDAYQQAKLPAYAVANPDYPKLEKVLANNNPYLLDCIINTSKGIPVKLMVGSNRQDQYMDYANGTQKQNGSGFPAFVALENILRNGGLKDVTLEKYLTSDTFAGHTAGTQFEKNIKDAHQVERLFQEYWNTPATPAKQKEKKEKKEKKETSEKKKDKKEASDPKKEAREKWEQEKARYSLAPTDESKISTVYAQMQRMAKLNPEKKINFNFVDDREDILTGLKEFYTQHPELIPSNVTLNLYQYNNGGQPVFFNKIQGQGFVDENYESSIKQIFTNALPDLRKLLNDNEQDWQVALKKNSSKLEVGFWKEKPGAEAFTFLIMKQRQQLRKLIERVTLFPKPVISTTDDAFTKSCKYLLSLIYDDLKEKPIPSISFTAESVLLLKELNKLQEALKNKASTEQDKTTQLQAVEAFTEECLLPGAKWKQAVSYVIATAVAMVLGAGAGFIIGFLAGLWSGPGAIATGLAGLVAGAGSTSGALTFAGIAAGSLLGGGISGFATKKLCHFLFFNPQQRAVLRCVEASKDKVAKSATPASVG